MKTTGPFYLSVNYNAKDETWYKAQPMGINCINEMMKRIVAGSSLEASCKKLTNHSARKTLVNKLKKTNVERSSIVKVTGHRNLHSLDDYDEGDEAEQRDLSTKISQRNNLQISNPSFSFDDKRSGSRTTNMAFDKPCFSQSLVRHESKHQMFSTTAMSPLMSYHPADRIRMFKFQNQSDGELSCLKAIPTSSTWTLFEYFVLRER